MNMKKVYGMPGTANAQVVLTSPSGKTKYKIQFTGGITASRDRTPAKFITDSPIIQDVIENDPTFNRKIFLLNAFENQNPPRPDAGEKKVVKAEGKKKSDPKKKEETGTKVYEDVTTLGDAITIIMSTGKASGDSVTSIEGVLQKAQELDISFPNLAKE